MNTAELSALAMTGLGTPHGGTLIDPVARGDEAAALCGRAADLPSITLSWRQLTDLSLIANGAFSPLFDRFTIEEWGITPIKFENSFYCRRCTGMATAKTCPHDAADHVTLSGTAVRALLRAGEFPPAEFSRPEVASVLVDAMQEAAEKEASAHVN